jgi:hypothetical protein
VDAPFHFNEEGWKVGEIPLQRLIARGELNLNSYPNKITKNVIHFGACRHFQCILVAILHPAFVYPLLHINYFVAEISTIRCLDS